MEKTPAQMFAPILRRPIKNALAAAIKDGTPIENIVTNIIKFPQFLSSVDIPKDEWAIWNAAIYPELKAQYDNFVKKCGGVK